MSNDQDIAVGPEDEASGITEQQRQNDPQGETILGKDAEVKPFNDEPTRASTNPELAPTSDNPNEPKGEKPAVNLTALLIDMYAVSGQKAYEMLRFGKITIGDEEWTDKTSFAVPYEQIQGKEVTILEEGRGGFKFTYGG